MNNSLINPRDIGTRSSAEEVIVSPPGAWSSASERFRRRVPLFITRSQAYYWTREWQEGEAEADEELRRGEARTFDAPGEALRWLNSPED
jgi:hypothetical protein